MQIIDYKAQLKKLYRPSDQVELVEVPPMNFLMIEGQGDPGSAPEYQEAVDALFSLAHALKSAVKRTDGIEYGVLPLEGQWWGGDMSRSGMERKGECRWNLMIHQPTPVTRKVFEKALADLKAKSPAPALSRMRFESLADGRAAQKLHVGPFGQAGPSIKAVQDRIQAIGAKPAGRHHEIYLSDLRKAAPEKWRTIIRQPYV